MRSRRVTSGSRVGSLLGNRKNALSAFRTKALPAFLLLLCGVLWHSVDCSFVFFEGVLNKVGIKDGHIVEPRSSLTEHFPPATPRNPPHLLLIRLITSFSSPLQNCIQGRVFTQRGNTSKRPALIPARDRRLLARHSCSTRERRREPTRMGDP